MKARLVPALVCALGTMAAGVTPAFALEPVVVVATDKTELEPAASTTYLAWTVVGRYFRHANVWAQAIGSGAPFRVNPSGTTAGTGGIEGSTLIYEQSLPGQKQEFVMVDLSTRTELDMPDGVNTGHEYSPSFSGTHLLFGRRISHSGSIVLFDTSTGTSQVLFSKTNTDRRVFNIVPGQVNGNYAVWWQVVIRKKGGVIGGDVWLYDIAAATTTKIPSAEGVWQSSPSVDTAGTVYFRRKTNFNFDCGEDAELVERQIDGTESLLYTFPSGSDFFFPVAVDNADGTTDVYFDGGRCEDLDFSDIWKLPGV